jgi:hypothetical protein
MKPEYKYVYKQGHCIDCGYVQLERVCNVSGGFAKDSYWRCSKCAEWKYITEGAKPKPVKQTKVAKKNDSSIGWVFLICFLVSFIFVVVVSPNVNKKILHKPLTKENVKPLTSRDGLSKAEMLAYNANEYEDTCIQYNRWQKGLSYHYHGPSYKIHIIGPVNNGRPKKNTYKRI